MMGQPPLNHTHTSTDTEAVSRKRPFACLVDRETSAASTMAMGMHISDMRAGGREPHEQLQTMIDSTSQICGMETCSV